MFEGHTTPKGIIKLVLSEIERLGGLREAFPHKGRIQLYTGPNNKYVSEIIGPRIENKDRAIKQAHDWEAILLDETPVGEFLFKKNNLYEWLNKVHAKAKTSKIRDRKVAADAKEVMTFVSALFIRAASGHVKTACCGARRDRVMYETEIEGMCNRDFFPPEARALVEALLDNEDIETINGKPIKLFRNIYRKKGLEAVYDLICKTELWDRWRHAKEECTWAAAEDYLDRLELNRVDRLEMQIDTPFIDKYSKVFKELELPEGERLAIRETRLRRFTAPKALMAASRPLPPMIVPSASGPDL